MQTTTWSGLTMYYTVPFSIRKITWAALIVNCAGVDTGNFDFHMAGDKHVIFFCFI